MLDHDKDASYYSTNYVASNDDTDESEPAARSQEDHDNDDTLLYLETFVIVSNVIYLIGWVVLMLSAGVVTLNLAMVASGFAIYGARNHGHCSLYFAGVVFLAVAAWDVVIEAYPYTAVFLFLGIPALLMAWRLP